MASSRIRRFFIKITIVVAAAVIGLVMAELFLRLMIKPTHISLFTYNTDSERYKVMKSNYEGIVYGVPLRTNELGFRDAGPGPIPAKQPNEFRVAVLGDSYTVSAGVPYENLASVQLEKLLREQFKPRPVRVLNLGTAGYSLIEYAVVLEMVAIPLQTDLVVVANYVPNDYELKTWVANRDIAYGRKEPPKETFWESIYLNKAVGPIAGALWSSAIGKLTRPSRGNAPQTSAKPSFGEGSEGWTENINAMREIATRTKEKKIPLRFCLLPHTSNFTKQTRNHGIVTEVCRQTGIAVTDVLPRLIKDGRPPFTFRVNLIDSHPNAAYQTIVAKAMFDAITDSGSLTSPPAQ